MAKRKAQEEEAAKETAEAKQAAAGLDDGVPGSTWGQWLILNFFKF